MITEALLHCAGVGPIRLAKLHGVNVRSWQDVLAHAHESSGKTTAALVEECQRCLQALTEEDIRYFCDHFVPQDRWRILSQFFERTTFFDIETTGLELDARITVIVCWHRGKLHHFVEHQNLDDFLQLLDDVDLLASFNGSSFDVPRVLDAFHIPQLPCPHMDLRWACYHRGWTGGLKEIAQALRITRPADLHGADGALAVRLWYAWRESEDAAALNRLLRYCAADVLLLVMVADRLAGRDTHDDTLWSHLPASAAEPVVAGLPHVEQAPFGAAAPSKLRARPLPLAG